MSSLDTHPLEAVSDCRLERYPFLIFPDILHRCRFGHQCLKRGQILGLNPGEQDNPALAETQRNALESAGRRNYREMVAGRVTRGVAHEA